MAKRKKTPKIKLAISGLGGKSKEDLVREANKRRQEKIKAVKKTTGQEVQNEQVIQI